MTEQTQRGGTGSTNIQVFQSGAQPAEVRALVLDIVHAELFKYQQRADTTVKERLEKITDDVLAMVAGKAEGTAESFSDPDIQYSTATVGREYARTGSEDLGEVLVGLLGDRLEASSRSLLAVVLNDAIQTAGRLTDREIDALSVIWRLTRTVSLKMNSLARLQEFLAQDVAQFVLPEGDASYYHLESLGCGTIQSLNETQFAAAMLEFYPGVFSKGFFVTDVPGELRSLIGTDAFVPCLRAPDRLQINAATKDVLEKKAALTGIPDALTHLKQLESNSLMNTEEAEAEILRLEPRVARNLELWKQTDARHFRVSAVGIAIAHSNYRRTTAMTAPLSTWIS